MNITKFIPVFSFFAGWITLGGMPPWNFWPAVAIGLSALYLILQRLETKKQSFLNGWLFAMGFFLPGLSWIGNAFLVEGNDFKWVWPFAIAGLPILLSLFYGYAAVLFNIFKKQNSNWLLFILLITMTEWVRGNIFTGFPWNLFGYSWGNVPQIMQTVSIGGIYFLSLLTIMWLSLPGLMICQRTNKNTKIKALAFVMFTLALCYSYGHFRISKTPLTYREDARIRLVQPNIKQEDKWNAEKISQNVNKLLRLSRKNKDENTALPEIIIWPETAITTNIYSQPAVRDAVLQTLNHHEPHSVILTGLLRSTSRNDKKQYYNSLGAINKDNGLQILYDKTHLVPFGEYIPFKDYVPFKPFAFYSGFSAGNGSKPTTILKTLKINPLICYEIVFAGEAQTTEQNDRSSMIVNVTNDAWYGDTSGPRQHFEMARYRAIETGLPIIRVANTGISGVIDPLGRITKKIPLMEEKSITAKIPEVTTKPTSYTRFRESTFYLSVLFIAFLLIFDLRQLQDRINI